MLFGFHHYSNLAFRLKSVWCTLQGGRREEEEERRRKRENEEDGVCVCVCLFLCVPSVCGKCVSVYVISVCFSNCVIEARSGQLQVLEQNSRETTIRVEQHLLVGSHRMQERQERISAVVKHMRFVCSFELERFMLDRS